VRFSWKGAVTRTSNPGTAPIGYCTLLAREAHPVPRLRIRQQRSTPPRPGNLSASPVFRKTKLPVLPAISPTNLSRPTKVALPFANVSIRKRTVPVPRRSPENSSVTLTSAIVPADISSYGVGSMLVTLIHPVALLLSAFIPSFTPPSFHHRLRRQESDLFLAPLQMNDPPQLRVYTSVRTVTLETEEVVRIGPGRLAVFWPSKPHGRVRH
jgi:hypothetical protein